MGVETEFGNMKPKELEREQHAVAEKKKEKKDLESKTKFLGDMKSEAFVNLTGLIETKLTDRIKILIEEDPEATAYVTILHELGLKKAIAAQAAKKLENLYLNKKEE